MAAGAGRAGLRPYEVVVWGATGFTGRLMTRYLAEHGPADLRWAIAGRRRPALEELRRSVARPGSAYPEVLESTAEEAALRDIARQTQVVAALVGPFALHGEPMVAACVAEGTHYCDITGETTFVRDMRDRHGAAAKRAGVALVHCCGFDSVPADLGVDLLVRHVRATYGCGTNRVRAYVRAHGGASGGTMASGLNMVRQPGAVDRMSDPVLLCERPGGVVAEDDDSVEEEGPRVDLDKRPGEVYAIPFFMARINTRVVRRSAELAAALGQRYSAPDEPFSYRESQLTRSWNTYATSAVATALEPCFVALARVPGLLDLVGSSITQPGDGPSEEERAKHWFEYTLVGRPADPTGRAPPRVVVVVRGKDPGYDETAKMLSQAVLSLARDRDVPAVRIGGGSLTPAIAFGPLLTDRLRDAGMTFDVLTADPRAPKL